LHLAAVLAALARQLPARLPALQGVLTDGTLEGPPVAPQEAALERLRRRLAGVQERLQFCARAGEASHVYFLEATAPNEAERRPGWTLLAQPIEISRILAEWWTRQPTVICTSATLTTGQGSFTFLAGRLGLPAAETLTVPSPFDYPGRVRLVVTPVAGQDEAGHGYYAALAQCMADLLEAAPGKALLLFTSYRALDAVWQRLAGDPRLAGWRLLRQGNEPTAVLTQALRSAGAASRMAVCATRSWWQGVDVPGMRLVVIVKLPFPQLGHPLTEARLASIEQSAGRAFPHYMLPQALITLRQGVGRLMRTERDYGAIAICDARIERQAYGRQFVQALPAVPILRSAAELRAWIASMEPARLVPA
jgi:ATP-dependent DNA helicase DinG